MGNVIGPCNLEGAEGRGLQTRPGLRPHFGPGSCNHMSQPCRVERPPVLSCGQHGLPVGTSARPMDVSPSGGLSYRALQAARAGCRKPNSDVPDPPGRCMERDCTTAYKPGRGPCAPTGHYSGSALCAPGEKLRDECSVRAVQPCGVEAAKPGLRAQSGHQNRPASWCPRPLRTPLPRAGGQRHLFLPLRLLPDVPPAL